MAEKMEISETIEKLEFNKGPGSKVLAMISGDIHFLTYSHGGSSQNPWGSFPIFQCAPMAKKNSCKADQQYSVPPSYLNGQYCLFEFKNKCLKFEGYSFDKKVMEYDTCRDY
jgi:hypothetical protein